MRSFFFSCIFSLLAVSSVFADNPHLYIHVVLSNGLHGLYSGRLLVFIEPGTGAKSVSVDEFHPSRVYVTAKDVESWTPGTAVDIDADDVVFPESLSKAKPGDYQMQAVLDVMHSYNYVGRATGDLVSDVVPLKNFDPKGAMPPSITVTHVFESGAKAAVTDESVHPFAFSSKALSHFWGHEVFMKGYVVTPPSYEANPQTHYPTVYWTHGFGGNDERIEGSAEMFARRMKEKKMPAMIWVVLDESCPTGTHEFADSVNNGPWGEALTTELIPDLENTYRMDAKPSGRFLQGHSSGGWATLWLQTTYPAIFGGTWSTSPDPSDFHDFTGPDLYAPHANLYRKSDGAKYPLVRDKGQVIATMEQFAKMEYVMGSYGGQIASFEWVFSPRAEDGRPMQMFNRETGDVDPHVVAYWHDHYDIAHRVAERWNQIGPDLRGKIHLIVGTADTFYLDGPAHKLQAVLDSLHADAHFTYLEGKTHMDLYQVGSDRMALIDQIAKEMYAVARPASNSK